MRRTFKDRVEAGQLLARELKHYAGTPGLLVLALPRGGVPVAYEVARSLRAPLDVFLVRKLGLPGHEELAMGAIATGGVRVLNDEVVRSLHVSEAVLNEVARREEGELRRRELAYRGHPGTPEVSGKTVILIDDGIATGSTMLAAIRALRQQRPARLVVAVPTAAAESCRRLRGEVDELAALIEPEDFYAVGQWYVRFEQTSDEEVVRLLEQARRFPGPAA